MHFDIRVATQYLVVDGSHSYGTNTPESDDAEPNRRGRHQLTLDEAIEHCRKIGESQTACGQEHLQLSEWLLQYKQLLDRFDSEEVENLKVERDKLQEELRKARDTIFKLITGTMPPLTDEEIDKALALGKKEAELFSFYPYIKRVL